MWVLAANSNNIKHVNSRRTSARWSRWLPNCRCDWDIYRRDVEDRMYPSTLMTLLRGTATRKISPVIQEKTKYHYERHESCNVDFRPNVKIRDGYASSAMQKGTRLVWKWFMQCSSSKKTINCQLWSQLECCRTARGRGDIHWRCCWEVSELIFDLSSFDI